MIVYEINDNFIPFSQISYIFASININSKFLSLEFIKFCSCNLKPMTIDKKVNTVVNNLEFYAWPRPSCILEIEQTTTELERLKSTNKHD